LGLESAINYECLGRGGGCVEEQAFLTESFGEIVLKCWKEVYMYFKLAKLGLTIGRCGVLDIYFLIYRSPFYRIL